MFPHRLLAVAVAQDLDLGHLTGHPYRMDSDGLLTTWDAVVADARAADHYPRDVMDRLPRAVGILREQVGELRGDSSSPLDPRFPWLLLNQAPWTRSKLVWLAEVIGRNRAASGFESLMRRVGDPVQFRQIEEVLRASEPFFDAGLRVEFDSNVCIEGKQYQPDMLVTTPCGHERLYVEVTHLFMPKSMREAGAANSKVFEMMNAARYDQSPHLYMNWCLLRVPTNAEQAQIEELVASLATRVRTTSAFAHDAIEGLIEVGAATTREDTRLVEWCSAHGLKPGESYGPEFDPREGQRTAKTIRQKTSQLPRDVPGLLIISNQRVHLDGARDPASLEREDAMREGARSRPQLLAAVQCLVQICGGPPRMHGVVRRDWVSVAHRRPFDGEAIDYEIVWNPEFRLERPVKILRALYRGLRRHHSTWPVAIRSHVDFDVDARSEACPRSISEEHPATPR